MTEDLECDGSGHCVERSFGHLWRTLVSLTEVSRTDKCATKLLAELGAILVDIWTEVSVMLWSSRAWTETMTRDKADSYIDVTVLGKKKDGCALCECKSVPDLCTPRAPSRDDNHKVITEALYT